jgi:dUTP pyrophosphatase
METPVILLVKRLSENAKLPYRATDGSAGLDLCASESTDIPSGTRRVVMTDLALAIPSGHYGRIAPRSGLAFKFGIDICAGVIDSDYRGPVGCVLANAGTETFCIKQGDRIAQLILERVSTPRVVETSNLDETMRGAGGFGSTGTETPADADLDAGLDTGGTATHADPSPGAAACTEQETSEEAPNGVHEPTSVVSRR